MGQHKHNPTAIAAKEAPWSLPGKRPKLSKREREAIITAMIQEYTGINAIMQKMAESGVTKPFG
jgi:hypothetical protein